MRGLFPWIKTFIHAAWCEIRPGPRALKGMALAALAAGALIYLAIAVRSAEGPLAPGAVIVLVELAAGAALLFLGQGLAKVIELLAKIPWPLRWSLIGAALLINLSLMGLKTTGTLAVIAWALVSALLVGAGLSVLIGAGWRNLFPVQRAVSLVEAGLGLALLLGGLAWYGLYRGFPEQPVMDAAATTGAPLERVTLPDPSQPGPYRVKTLTYGSGSDRFRPEFGAGAAIRTAPVDGSKLLWGSWDGLPGQLRTLYWGFDSKALPINGRVWYPESTDPHQTFPLVLMVHGNHLTGDFSDPGYAYLGELLASRGFIFVSVDENFLNGGPTDLLDSIKDENDARGWLLLEHLRAWKSWNGAKDNPFYGKVDLNKIALLGHSRGGEAAAIAAAFNRLPCYPDDCSQAFDYNFNIRAVGAIAPIDGQYTPASRATPLSDLDYFVLQGSHDSDMSTFAGMRQYERVRWDSADAQMGFKSALYIYRANHGQFNAAWGDDDLGLLRGGFLNRAALLSAADQAQVVKVYLSAFLEAALHDQRGYLPLFEDSRAAPGWLPAAVYINRFDQAGDRALANYEEDIDLGTTTQPGGQIVAHGLDTWREQRVKRKWGSGETNGVLLAWKEPEKPGQTAPSYTIKLPEVGFPVQTGDALIFNLADANQDPFPSPPANGPRQPIDLTVLLEDQDGQISALPLSRYQSVQPQLSAHLYKAPLFETNPSSEPVFESYVLPLKDFADTNPGFHPERLKSIHFVFDRTKRGSVLLDAVGVREAR